MAEPVITNAEGVARLTLKTAITAKVGDLIGHDGTDWVLADADARIPAQFMAMQFGIGEAIAVCRSGVLFDSDAPYTAGNDRYLTATGGAHGALPAIGTTLTLMQRIGKALTTDTLAFDLSRRGPDQLRSQVTYDAASLAAVTARSDTLTETGLQTTDQVLGHLGAPLAGVGWDSGLVINSMDVSAADTLRVRLVNASAAALDGASVTLEVYVLRPTAN